MGRKHFGAGGEGSALFAANFPEFPISAYRMLTGTARLP
jgi:hypothetical protein